MQNSATAAAAIPDLVRTTIEDRLRDGDLELPMLPQVSVEVLQLCRAPDTDAHAITAILHRDQSIAGNVLRVANSPLCGARVRINSLQQAVSRLGVKALSQVVLAVSMQARMFEVPERWLGALSDDGVVRDLRQASFLAALFAKEIARIKRSNVENAFLIGLLHDMGKPVLCMMLADFEGATGVSFKPNEVRTVLDVFHTELGARLATSWDLPPTIAEAIRHQHDWSTLDPPPDGAALIALASRLAAAALDGSCALCADQLDQAMLTELNLYRDEVQKLCEMAAQLIATAGEF